MAAFATPKFVLQREQQIIGVFVVDLDVEIARDAEGVRAGDAHLRKNQARVARNEIFERDERAPRALHWNADHPR